ncbi:Adenosyl-chloride synthase [compost metagenome]
MRGIIPVLDEKYGNVWTNIPKALFEELGIAIGDKVEVHIRHGGKLVSRVVAPYRNTFGEVPKGQPLVYLNSLLEVAIALNEGNFAAKHKISSGLDWQIEFRKPK